MSKFANAIIMLPVVVIMMLITEITLGRFFDQFQYIASGLVIEGSRPEWYTPILGMFTQIHLVTFLIAIAWIVYAVLCAISDAMYTRPEGY